MNCVKLRFQFNVRPYTAGLSELQKALREGAAADDEAVAAAATSFPAGPSCLL
jgi:hypothetical protein